MDQVMRKELETKLLEGAKDVWETVKDKVGDLLVQSIEVIDTEEGPDAQPFMFWRQHILGGDIQIGIPTKQQPPPEVLGFFADMVKIAESKQDELIRTILSVLGISLSL